MEFNLSDKLHSVVYVPTKNPSRVAACDEGEFGFDLIERIEEIETHYILSPTELLELKKQWADEVWDMGRKDYVQDFNYMERGIQRNPNHPNKTQYINNLTL